MLIVVRFLNSECNRMISHCELYENIFVPESSVGNRAGYIIGYKTIEELKQSIKRLPKGSKITWVPGCVRFGGEPLSSEEEISNLENIYKSHGIIFELIPSG